MHTLWVAFCLAVWFFGGNISHADDCVTHVPEVLDSDFIRDSQETLRTIFLADGGTSGGGGGGSGVACFKNPADAREAQRAWQEKRAFPRHLLPKLVRLETTEYFEHPEVEYSPWPFATDSRSYAEFIVAKSFSSTSPSFYAKIVDYLNHRITLDENQIADMSGELEPLHDTGPIRGLERPADSKLCSPVQIAIRRGKWVDGKIQAVVGLDKDLYDRLGMKDSKISNQARIINQALLRVHEALYLLGFGFGQKTSEKVREMTSKLFSERHPSPNALHLLLDLNEMGFGDFLDLEPTEPLPLNDPKYSLNSYEPSKNEIHAAYRKVMTDLSDLRKAGAWDALNSSVSRYSGPEAFVFFGITALQDGTLIDFAPLVSRRTNGYHQITGVCSKASLALEQQQPSKNGYIEKALRYCHERLKFR